MQSMSDRRPLIQSLDRRMMLSAVAGSLDTTFGDGGVVRIATTGLDAVVVSATAFAPDGKLVAFGYAEDAELRRPVVARFDANGVADTTFGGDGVVLLPAGHFNRRGLYLDVQPDGKILLGGTRFNHLRPILLRLNADGTTDGSFGTGGYLQVPLNAGGGDNLAAMVVAEDGKIFLLGGGNGQRVLARLNADGSLDNSFGRSGRIVSSFELAVIAAASGHRSSPTPQPRIAGYPAPSRLLRLARRVMRR